MTFEQQQVLLVLQRHQTLEQEDHLKLELERQVKCLYDLDLIRDGKLCDSSWCESSDIFDVSVNLKLMLYFLEQEPDI